MPLKNYTHQTPYILPVPPSPNLPNQQAVLLYPSLCFFEGTVVSVGRGNRQAVSGHWLALHKIRPVHIYPRRQARCHQSTLGRAALLRSRFVERCRYSKKGLMLDYFFDYFKRARTKASSSWPHKGIDDWRVRTSFGCKCWRAFRKRRSAKAGNPR